MKLSDFINWITSGQALTLMRVSKSGKELYRLCFLGRAAEIGILRSLDSRPAEMPELIEALGIEEQNKEAFAALLNIGISVGEIGRRGECFFLKGKLAKALAKSRLDPMCAFVEEITGLHVPYILSAAGDNEARGKLSALTNAFADVVARSSRILEPFLSDVTDNLIPASGQFALLEVGCGSGVYLFRALKRNPQLTAIGVEIQSSVAENVCAQAELFDYTGRVEIINADVRSLQYECYFDLITLHNNIYYFPEAERPALLAKLLSWIKPGGKIVVSTGCLNDDLFSSLGVLWTAMTDGAGPLPEPAGFCLQLKDAGFSDVRCNKTGLLNSYRVFTGAKQ